jgi:hypothetical protein
MDTLIYGNMFAPGNMLDMIQSSSNTKNPDNAYIVQLKNLIETQKTLDIILSARRRVIKNPPLLSDWSEYKHHVDGYMLKLALMNHSSTNDQLAELILENFDVKIIIKHFFDESRNFMDVLNTSTKYRSKFYLRFFNNCFERGLGRMWHVNSNFEACWLCSSKPVNDSPAPSCTQTVPYFHVIIQEIFTEIERGINPSSEAFRDKVKVIKLFFVFGYREEDQNTFFASLEKYFTEKMKRCESNALKLRNLFDIYDFIVTNFCVNLTNLSKYGIFYLKMNYALCGRPCPYNIENPFSLSHISRAVIRRMLNALPYCTLELKLPRTLEEYVNGNVDVTRWRNRSQSNYVLE